MEKVERIVSAMNQSAKAVRESAWRIAVESWLQSKEFYQHPHQPKVLPNFTPFLNLRIGRVNTGLVSEGQEYIFDIP